MRRQAKLPTILGLILLVFGIAGGVVLVQTRQVFNISASPEETPQQVKITDITDKSFSVSWVTEKPTAGFVSYGTSEKLGTVISQKLPTSQASVLHYITIEGLKPNTEYFFKIGSGKNTYGKNNGAYRQKTAPAPSTLPETDIIFGTVSDQSGNAARGVIVYAAFANATTLSAVTDEAGRWSMPLSTARTPNLSSFAVYNRQTDILEITVQGGEQIASAKVLTGSSRPVPPITLGKSHDFTKLPPAPEGGLPKSEVSLPEDTVPQGGAQSGFSVEEQGTKVGSIQVKLTNPQDGEKVSSTNPQFVGTGTPGTAFTIKVESEVSFSDKVTVDKSGKWSWSVPKELSPGEHTVTLSWNDEKGQARTAKRSFTVLAAGESQLPAFSASPSGSAATKSPSPSPSPSPKASPSPSPKPVKTPSPSPKASPLPEAGDLTSSLTILIMGLVLLFAGIFLPKTKFLK